MNVYSFLLLLNEKKMYIKENFRKLGKYYHRKGWIRVPTIQLNIKNVNFYKILKIQTIMFLNATT